MHTMLNWTRLAERSGPSNSTPTGQLVSPPNPRLSPPSLIAVPKRLKWGGFNVGVVSETPTAHPSTAESEPPPLTEAVKSKSPGPVRLIETVNVAAPTSPKLFTLKLAVPVGVGRVVLVVVVVVVLGTVVVVAPLPTVTAALATLWSTVLVARTSKLPGWLPAVKWPLPSTVPPVVDHVTFPVG